MSRQLRVAETVQVICFATAVPRDSVRWRSRRRTGV